MTVVEFRRKGKKISIESAVQQVVDSKPDEVLVIGKNSEWLSVFHSGQSKAQMLWLLEETKAALMAGELDHE